MNTKLATSQIHLKNWATIIQDRKESGLSVNDYCSQHQLSRDAYYYWLRKIKENLLVESGFVEVALPVPLPVQKSQPSELTTPVQALKFCARFLRHRSQNLPFLLVITSRNAGYRSYFVSTSTYNRICLIVLLFLYF